MGELTENDEEDDEAGDPGVVFVRVDDLVAKEGDDEGCGGDDDDTCVARNICVDGVKELRTNYHVD